MNSWVPSRRAGVHRFLACRPAAMPAGQHGCEWTETLIGILEATACACLCCWCKPLPDLPCSQALPAVAIAPAAAALPRATDLGRTNLGTQTQRCAHGMSGSGIPRESSRGPAAIWAAPNPLQHALSGAHLAYQARGLLGTAAGARRPRTGAWPRAWGWCTAPGARWRPCPRRRTCRGCWARPGKGTAHLPPSPAAQLAEVVLDDLKWCCAGRHQVLRGSAQSRLLQACPAQASSDRRTYHMLCLWLAG